MKNISFDRLNSGYKNRLRIKLYSWRFITKNFLLWEFPWRRNVSNKVQLSVCVSLLPAFLAQIDIYGKKKLLLDTVLLEKYIVFIFTMSVYYIFLNVCKPHAFLMEYKHHFTQEMPQKKISPGLKSTPDKKKICSYFSFFFFLQLFPESKDDCQLLQFVITKYFYLQQPPFW